MPKLQFTGLSHYREISKADLNSLGFSDQPAIRVARHDIDPGLNVEPRKAPTEVEVSDEVAAWLLANEKGDWKAVEEPVQQAEGESTRASRSRS